MSGILVVECPVCGTTRVITEEHHICTDCGYDFFDDDTDQEDDE